MLWKASLSIGRGGFSMLNCFFWIIKMPKIESSKESHQRGSDRGYPGKLLYILHSWRARWFNWIFIFRTTHCRILTKSQVKYSTARLSLTVSRPKPITLSRRSQVPYPSGSARSVCHPHFYSGNVPFIYGFRNNFT